MANINATEYSNNQAITEVLGSLMQKPSLLKEYKITSYDFPENFYRIILSAICKLYENKAQEIDAVAIDETISHSPSHYIIFTKNRGIEFVDLAKNVARVENFDYYYNQLRKFSLLRKYMENGTDVSDYFDPKEINPSIIERKRELFDKSTIEEIAQHFKEKQLQITSEYILPSERTSKKAGEGALEQKNKWKNGVAWGLGYSSAYLTSVSHGIRQGRFTVMTAPSGIGKAIPNYTTIPTPTGFKIVGDIKVGDYIFGKDGKPVKVLQIHPQAEKKEIYKVKFTDGRVAECCKDHLWQYNTEGHREDITKVKTTEEIYKRAQEIGYRGYEGCIRFKMPVASAVEYERKEFKIPPYVMGAFLGDGSFRFSPSNKELTFSAQTEETPSKIADMMGWIYKKNSDFNYNYVFFDKNNKKIKVEDFLVDYPELINAYSYDKFIPEDYQLGSIEQRMEMLRGLLDTDGNVQPRNGRVTYCSVSYKLIYDTKKMCESLGFICKVFLDKREGQRDCYNLGIRTEKVIKPQLFSLERKVKIAKEYYEKNKDNKVRNVDYIGIEEIIPTGKYTDMTCFTVDSEDHLFLMNDYIVTHNTRITVANLCHAFAPYYYDKKLDKWCENTNSKGSGALYIGTEMELLEEIEPILWAYIADVPQDHIEFNRYEDGEEERVEIAIKLLEEHGNIWLEYVPNYDIGVIENLIETHKSKHNVDYVFFDYIYSTTELFNEYSAQSKIKMQVREDQVLANLSTKLKDMCRKYNVSIDTWTQVSGDFKNENNKDQTIVRGAKSIID